MRGAVEMAETDAKIGRIYAACCQGGAGVTLIALQKFAQDFKLLDNSNLKPNDVDLIYQRVKEVGKQPYLDEDRFKVHVRSRALLVC